MYLTCKSEGKNGTYCFGLPQNNVQSNLFRVAQVVCHCIGSPFTRFLESKWIQKVEVVGSLGMPCDTPCGPENDRAGRYHIKCINVCYVII